MFIMIFLPITRFEPRTSRVEVTALPTEPQPLSNLPSYLWPYYVDWISLSSLGTCFERTTKIKEKLLFSVFWLSQDFRFGDFFLGQEIGVKNLKSSKLDPSINQEKKIITIETNWLWEQEQETCVVIEKTHDQEVVGSNTFFDWNLTNYLVPKLHNKSWIEGERWRLAFAC